MEEEIWSFTDIFKDKETKSEFLQDVIASFEQFPPDYRLNCDDLYSIMSIACANIPYNFIVFVCECVDPSITSGTIMSHRIMFGNFLLALPCCILYPQFMHTIVSLFKTEDTLRKGVISRKAFIECLKCVFTESFDAPKDDYPNIDLLQVVEESTSGMPECSVITLMFIMWQKEDSLIRCRTGSSLLSSSSISSARVDM